MNNYPARASAIILSWLGVGLAGCNQTTPNTERATAPPVAADTTAQPLAPAPALIPDTINWMAPRRDPAGPADTTLLIDGQRYRLLLTAVPDSSRKLTYTPQYNAESGGPADSTRLEAPDVVTGVDMVLRFTLLDAQNKTVFRRELRKKDFNGVVAEDILVPSEPQLPALLGYVEALKGFAFQQTFFIPDTDVGSYAVLLLGLDGRLRELAYSNSLAVDRTDCEPRLAPNGRALLTCTQLLVPGRKPISLQKPAAQTVLARFLSDTTLLVVYAYGTYRYTQDEAGGRSMEFVEPPRMRTVPNAFVLNLQGQPLASFRYNGYTNELGYSVPRHYLPQTSTYYLLDEARGLRLLNKRQPTSPQEIRFRQMARFTAPQRPREVQFRLQGTSVSFDFYVDPDRPEQIRYRKVSGE
ncbi:hypothetical protein KBK19_13900 [Microvirga sp. STR05]|uniref:Uncharacterized protein n=1 Tax=Hymenobacter duratus TaxID=2771356 RepID=A0ABR8JKH4_9BACT|nr:hypothetical protein [Hymenobacter duratus]MBD2716131.1 hypothetical protein [Hymenobacter duratus]MBR7951045.1 hypothetical protein [Microvirga sp. STR05]